MVRGGRGHFCCVDGLFRDPDGALLPLQAQAGILPSKTVARFPGRIRQAVNNP